MLGYSEADEKRTIERFKREARPHLEIEPPSQLDWLAIAQHHGVPTRLLDWTESPLIAAYFAVRAGDVIVKGDKYQRVDAAIYGMRCPRIIETDEDCNRISDEVAAYYPRHLTPRITAQRGLFIWHRQPAKPYSPPELGKWVINRNARFELKFHLNKCGINDASMFPGVDGIARHVA